MWHRPSVLVFDNLEKLLGTELEVCWGYSTGLLGLTRDV